MRLFLHGVVVNDFVGIEAIADHVEPFSTDVQGHAVCEVTAFSQAHAHDGVAGF